MKTAHQENGFILVPNIETKLVEREPKGGGAQKLADEFKSKPAPLNAFVTLKFEPEAGKSCSEFPETKVKGQIAGEVITLANGNTEINFPSPELKGNTLEFFGVAATLTGRSEGELENGGAFRAGGPAPPHWYKAGAKLAESGEAGGLKVKTGTGGGKFTAYDSTKGKQAVCKMNDSGKIWNPVGGGSGEGTIEKATFTACESSGCKAAESPELNALKTPWKLVMIAGSPPAVEVQGMELEIVCNGLGTKYKAIAGMPVKLSIANGTGKGEAPCAEPTHTTQLRFKALVDMLEEPVGPTFAALEGDDCIWGEAAQEIITVESP